MRGVLLWITNLGWRLQRNAFGALAMMLGTMFAEPGSTAWVIGFMMPLMISALISLIYAWAFEHVTHAARRVQIQHGRDGWHRRGHAAGAVVSAI